VKHFPIYRHLKTGINFFVIGSTETSIGRKCFVCRETPQDRERLFEIDGFDVPFVEREALYLTLLKREKARKKAEEKVARAKRNRRPIEAREADEENEKLPSRDDEIEPDVFDQDSSETVDPESLIESEVLGDD
jgi:hypothetical protein